MDFGMQYTNNVEALMGAKGLEAKELAAMARLSTTTVRDAASGRSGMSLATACAIADALGCDLDTLAGRRAGGGAEDAKEAYMRGIAEGMRREAASMRKGRAQSRDEGKADGFMLGYAKGFADARRAVKEAAKRGMGAAEMLEGLRCAR